MCIDLSLVDDDISICEKSICFICFSSAFIFIILYRNISKRLYFLKKLFTFVYEVYPHIYNLWMIEMMCAYSKGSTTCFSLINLLIISKTNFFSSIVEYLFDMISCIHVFIPISCSRSNPCKASSLNNCCRLICFIIFCVSWACDG